MDRRGTAAIVTVAFSAMAAAYGQRARDGSSGSGFIYRTDGHGPPVFIRLGEGKNDRFDAILEEFKREHGFHGIPVAGGDQPASPYQIPVIGEDRTAVDYGEPGPRYDGGGGKYEAVLEDADDLAPDLDDRYSSSEDNRYGGFRDLPSPFKYHYDASADPKADTFDGPDDQNYYGGYGSPYTHLEHKHPGKHKSGGSFQKAGHYFAEGSAGDEGHKSHQTFDRGHAGKYGKDDLRSHYKNGAGHKAGHANEADHYGKQHGTAHGVKGNRFGETESHRKGHRTTGFHNVYHKDEYNKENMFYEDAHKHGKHDRYGGKHKDYAQKGGGHKHGHRYDAGYNEGHGGEAGHHGKGGYYDKHRGHSGESGHKSHHDHKAEYDQLADHKKYGEHESGGGGGYDSY